MAVKLQPWLLSVLLLVCFFIPFSSCQSDSPVNIETFYPFPIPSPAPSPSPISPNNTQVFPPPPPPVTPLPPPQAPLPVAKQDSTSNRTIAKAVAATAASTFVVFAMLFFLIRVVKRRGETGSCGTQAVVGGGGGVGDEFRRFDGNVKGLIVDENGLDVLYWKKLEFDHQRNSGFQKSVFHAPEHGVEKEEKEIIHGGNRRIQEIPLIHGRSSTSYNKIAPEVDDRFRVTAAPTEIAIQVIVKPPSPPPPPPPPVPSKPMPPPPPPVASKSTMSVSKNQTPSPAPPPPPPPVPAKKNPAPPPPPPRAISSKPPPVRRALQSESKVRESSSMAGSGNDQVKLKPLHWDKLKPNGDHSMVWDKIDNGSFRFDGDLMEALFGYVATSKKTPEGGGDNSSKKPTIPSQIVILDPRKSQNTAIIIKSLSISRREILDALNEGHGLELETLEKLTRIAPTDEEQSQILEFNGDIARLADAECFLYHLLKAVPSAFTRFNAMIFRSNYGSEISQLKESLQTLEAACKELRSQRLFMKLLEAILKAGNRMNAGTARGNAQAFKLTSLQKLSDVKSTDGKTTLLHFVVEQVVRSEGKRCVLNKNRSLSRSSSSSQSSYGSIISETNSASKDEREKEYTMLGLPIVGGLSSEFSNVKKAAAMDYDTLAVTCSALTSRVAEVKQLVTQCDGGFVREMKGFLEAAEEELQVVREEQMKVMKHVQRTTEYYQASASKDQQAHPLQLFGIIKDFLSMVDQVCVEIARKLQRRKTTMPGSGSSSPKSPPPRTPTRFPNLPAHFMKSRSSSSDSDSDT
ncbi:formin y 2 domain-containing family protein [Tripterygium wilfordii]|uniref:Formin-like protein n=1 Tax=Tripterygium wilfordii TaxID=458696 RepID=A0A7J7BY88_TRIWF|nr:formin-like protein 4 [Tripterygium wilfordii]KAF5726778.1 formin y 2 domain-containing family protein [Tripterygium wilfordii]